MNQKEISELRRRFQPGKSAISHIYGCYVNDSREIISRVDKSLGLMPEEEATKYLTLLKRAISGRLGKNLIDVVFSTQQVKDSQEHSFLMNLRHSELKDYNLRETLYQRIINNLDAEGSYLILLGYEAYDVPTKKSDDEDANKAADQPSDQIFRYFVCAVCPIHSGKPELEYNTSSNEFELCPPGQTVANPDIGFMFPAFDNRSTNIYSALYYSRKADEPHQEFYKSFFHVEPPMTATEQKETFQAALESANICSMAAFQGIHEQIKMRIDDHNEAKEAEPLVLTSEDICEILTDCDVKEDHVKAFQSCYNDYFGKDMALFPENIIDSGKYEIKMGDTVLNIPPDRSHLIETRIIDGVKYLLIPVDSNAEVNGFPVIV